jgi:hypothetical protein
MRTMLAAGVVAQIINADAIAVFAGALKEVAAAKVSDTEAAVAVAVTLAVMLIPSLRSRRYLRRSAAAFRPGADDDERLAAA